MQFHDGRQGDTTWLGCPAVPEQMLTLCRRRIAEHFPEWEEPDIDHTVALIAEIAQMGVELRNVNQSISLGGKMSNEANATNLVGRERRLRARAQLLGGREWKSLCKAAGHENLESMTTTIREYVQNTDRVNHSGKNRTIAWEDRSGMVPQLMVKREPKADESKLTEAQAEKLEGYLRRGATIEITIDDASLLTDMAGSMLRAMQPGGRDLAPVSMTPVAKEYIMAVREELYTENSLRMVPEVALAKLLTLNMGGNDNFVFEFFGHVAFKDTCEDPTGLMTIKGVSRDIQARKARKHVWMLVRRIEHLENIIQGIARAAKHMHHPSILSYMEIIELGYIIKAAYEKHAGYTQVNGLFSAFKIRMVEHAASVRAKASGTGGEVPPLTEWGKRSSTVFNRAVEAAKNACLLRVANGTEEEGETTAGAHLKTPEGIDATGKKPFTNGPRLRTDSVRTQAR